MPIRIQRKRTKGWRMPEETVNVARPGFWGNLFTVDEWGRELAVKLHRNAMTGFWNPRDLPAEWPDSKFALGAELFKESRHQLECLYQLRGHDVACWCKEEELCHGDTYLELANA